MLDRALPPVPDGVELYLAAEDLMVDEEELAARILSFRPAGDFAYVVEGPLRSLDGHLFDVTVDSEANHEVLRRLVSLGRRIEAEAVVIHAMAPRASVEDLINSDREAVLAQATAFLRRYARLCHENDLVPTIEDIPPVGFMREALPSFSLLGVAPEDMEHLCRAVPGLEMTLDISHAQLYINAANSSNGIVPGGLEALVKYWQGRRSVASLGEYIDITQEHLFEAHISNARGITGEGLSCYDGELDIAAVGRRLAPHVRFLVTETIEPDPDQSVLMREVQRCLQTALTA